ncbi:MAG: hypothetical protein KDC87_16700 [Planctomycetes bacterium]|nr:hypothetical protein [Planctomycetota bacterium]MCB9871033.1 hypothetical protein [Planctomycetota bacterium]
MPPSDDPRQPPTENGRRLLRELDRKISTMETLLGNLHRTEARSGTSFQTVKVDLRARLTACYLARESLRRGEFQRVRDLSTLLLRLRIQLEHRRFAALGPISLDDLAGADVDALAIRFGGPAEDA